MPQLKILREALQSDLKQTSDATVLPPEKFFIEFGENGLT